MNSKFEGQRQQIPGGRMSEAETSEVRNYAVTRRSWLDTLPADLYGWADLTGHSSIKSSLHPKSYSRSCDTSTTCFRIKLDIVYFTETYPLRKKFSFSHWESQWNCSKIKISMRSWARTSLRIKNLIKNLIKNQDLWQDRIEILIEILNEKKILIENLNENLNEVLPKILIFDEVLHEVLDSQWGSWLGSWFSKLNFFRKGYFSSLQNFGFSSITI